MLLLVKGQQTTSISWVKTRLVIITPLGPLEKPSSGQDNVLPLRPLRLILMLPLGAPMGAAVGCVCEFIAPLTSSSVLFQMPKHSG